MSSPPSPPPGVSYVDFYMGLAYAKRGIDMNRRRALQQISLDVDNDTLGTDKTLDRCIALTENLLAEGRAALTQPLRLPSRLTKPVERDGSEHTPRDARDRLAGLVALRTACYVPLPPSPVDAVPTVRRLTAPAVPRPDVERRPAQEGEAMSGSCNSLAMLMGSETDLMW